jgi:hypothetical protein
VALSVQTFLLAELVGAAVLALWTVTAFPRLGPKTFRATLIVLGLALVLLQLDAVGVPLAVRLPGGAYVVLFGVLLPTFFAVFVSAAWTLRLLAERLGGGSGGGGHQEPAVGSARP